MGHHVYGGYGKTLIINPISQGDGTNQKNIGFNIEIGEMSIKAYKGRGNHCVEDRQDLYLTEGKAMDMGANENERGRGPEGLT